MLRRQDRRRPIRGNVIESLSSDRWVGASCGSRGNRSMRIEYLYRFPVKGLTAEALEEATVEPGGTIPWDRAFALAQGDSGFDAANPA